MRILLSLIAAACLLVTMPASAQAQDEGVSASTTREVVHGFYVKTGVGFVKWIQGWGEYSNAGQRANFSLGYDIIDQLGFTLTVEGSFLLSMNDGVPIQGSPVQGDFHSLGGIASVRAGINFGGRTIRRATFFIRAGGGVYYSPSLREQGDALAGLIHGQPGGLVNGGLGIEYFTKLAHFSVGAEFDYSLVVGLPVMGGGIGGTFFFKYTF